MLRKHALLILAIMVCWSTGFCFDSGDLVGSNGDFFAQQPPLQIARSDDEWGVASTAPKAEDQTVGYKSPSRAVLYSLLLPGLGEIYIGDSRTKAVGFLAAEVGIWSSFIYFKKLEDWKRDDYIELAVVCADIDPSGKDDFFFDMVGFYGSRDDYNKVSRVYSRANPFYPETPEWDWQWQDDDCRQQYRDLKNDSKTAKRNANFALGAAALNRAISMIFAWRSSRGHNRNLAGEFSRINLEIIPDSYSNSVGVRVEYTGTF
jgi:hypothetical protein